MDRPVAFVSSAPVEGELAESHEAMRASDGYVPNYVQVWSWRPEILEAYATLREDLLARSTLSAREAAVMVAATASSLGDSYCSLAWGERLAKAADADVASAVIQGADTGLSEREAALAAWARQMVRDPNGTTPAAVEALRAAGFDEREIFEATVWIGLRLGFSTINDALGIAPDDELRRRVPAAVRDAVTYGR